MNTARADYSVSRHLIQKYKVCEQLWLNLYCYNACSGALRILYVCRMALF